MAKTTPLKLTDAERDVLQEAFRTVAAYELALAQATNRRSATVDTVLKLRGLTPAEWHVDWDGERLTVGPIEPT